MQNIRYFTISCTVPVCPVCAGLLDKIMNDTGVSYSCVDCYSVFKPVDSGQAENELICEKVGYETTNRI